jgi:hypothetical protein
MSRALYGLLSSQVQVLYSFLRQDLRFVH